MTALSTSWQREPLDTLSLLPELLAEFWKEEELSRIWEELKPAYGARATVFSEHRAAVEEVVSGLDASAIEVRLLPNLLDLETRGYSVSTKAWTTIVIGGEYGSAGLAQIFVHELLHRWTDVAAEDAVEEWSGLDPMPRLRAVNSEVAQNYSDLAIWLSETIVRTATDVLSEKLWPDREHRRATIEDAWPFDSRNLHDSLESLDLRLWKESFSEMVREILDKTAGPVGSP